MGLIQLDHGSPALPPAGTRPDAIAPATAPMQYGTSTDDDANAAPKLRWLDVRVTSLRNAKLEPRNTMPSAASDERHEQRERDRRERLGERGPQHDEAEDQPDVVRLPHRADRVADHRARPRAALARRRR